MRALPVGEPGKSRIIDEQMNFALSRRLRGRYRAGIRQSGSYEVYISVGTRMGTPQIALPLPGDDGNRRFRLGILEVVSVEKQ
jgi:hypothetical protein